MATNYEELELLGHDVSAKIDSAVVGEIPSFVRVYLGTDGEIAGICDDSTVYKYTFVTQEPGSAGDTIRLRVDGASYIRTASNIDAGTFLTMAESGYVATETTTGIVAVSIGESRAAGVGRVIPCLLIHGDSAGT